VVSQLKSKPPQPTRAVEKYAVCPGFARLSESQQSVAFNVKPVVGAVPQWFTLVAAPKVSPSASGCTLMQLSLRHSVLELQTAPSASFGWHAPLPQSCAVVQL
jgi:hypothetical protein